MTTTLDELRGSGTPDGGVTLNDVLGLTDDSDARFGSTAQRNMALQDGCRRLWPDMARLASETITITSGTLDYALTTLRQVERLESTNSAVTTYYSDLGKDFAVWYDESTTSPTARLRLPQALDTTLTLKAVGYVPYAVPSSGSGTFDLLPEDEWIVVEGAVSWLYRRQMHSFVTYQRHENENRRTSLSMGEMQAMYRDAEARYQQAKMSHRRRLVVPKRAIRARP